jgi:2-iminobutanoate/2-iminopropanoate deaminase
MKRIPAIPGLAKPPSPFNHVVEANGFLFLSSQLSVDLKTHALLTGSMAEQTKQALENIKYLLESCGSKLEAVVDVSIYMRDVTQFDEMNKVYRTYFKDGQEPARVTVQAPSPLPGIDIEIKVTALAQESLGE